MKKAFSKSLSWLLSVVMILGVIVVAVPVKADAMSVNDFYNRLEQLKQKYPNGSTWTGTYRDSYGSGWVQCAGFSHLMGYEAFGNDPLTWEIGRNLNEVQPGDIIEYSDPNNGDEFWKGTNHTVFCIGVSGDVITYVDCNGSGGKNTVLWGGTVNISAGRIYRTGAYIFNFIRKSPIHNGGYDDNWESMPVGEKYYLKNNGTGTYMSIDYGEDAQGKNISVYSKMDHSSQQFEIRSSDSDKTYYLRPVLCESSGRVVNVYSESSYNGANVTIYNFTGHSTQQWKFRKVDGGYAICSANNTNTCLAESGTNVQLATYTGASNQIWTLETLHVHNYTEYVYNWAAHPHYKCYRCSCGEVMENRNEPTYVDTCADCIDSSRVDIGTDFYAYIINKASWKMASVVGESEYNVELESETGYNNQFWYFERQDNLYYKITNVKTNQCLDDANFGTVNGTNVGICSSNNGTAQRWAIIECNGGYELHPQCAINMSLDVNGGSSEDGTNIQIWESNHSAAQIFTIYRYGNTPDTPQLTMSGNLFENENVKISWNPCRFAHYYQVEIWHNGNCEQSFTTQNLSYTFEKLSAGDYGICVTSVNQNGRSNVATMDFTIPNYSISPTATATFNGHTYEYYNQQMNWNQAYKFCEKKGGHLVTVTSQEENDFIVNLAGDSSYLWIGGRTGDKNTWYWITGESFEYKNWSEGEPNDTDGKEDALEIYLPKTGHNGEWNDTDNSHCSAFICEYEDADASKYTPVYKENYNGHEYWFFEDTVDWQTAKKICEAKGGYLAIPNNAKENAFILSGINKTSKEEAWIGITDIAKEGTWKNVKGGSITYTNWGDGEPNNEFGIEDYVEIFSNGKWNDLRGFGANYRSVGFVCEFDGICLAGHNYTDEYVEATETETAHIIHKCSVCGYEWTESKTVFFETNGGLEFDSKQYKFKPFHT